MFSPPKKTDGSSCQQQGASEATAADSAIMLAMEVGVLEGWRDRGPELLRQVAFYLSHPLSYEHEGFANAQRDHLNAVTAMQTVIVEQLIEGLNLVKAFSKVDFSKLASDARHRHLDQVDSVCVKLAERVAELTRLNIGIVEAWWNEDRLYQRPRDPWDICPPSGQNSVAGWISFVRDKGMALEVALRWSTRAGLNSQEPVDLIAEANRFMPQTEEVNWEADPTSKRLVVSGNQRQIRVLFDEINRVILAHRKQCSTESAIKLLKCAGDSQSDGNVDYFQELHKTLFPRAPVRYNQDQVDGALTISVLLTPQVASLWSGSVDALNEQLAFAKQLASANSLQLSVQMQPDATNPRLVVSLAAITSIRWKSRGDHGTCLRFNFSVSPPPIEFPLRVSVGDEVKAVRVAAPLCSFEEPKNVLALGRALEGVSGLIGAVGWSRIDSVKVEAFQLDFFGPHSFIDGCFDVLLYPADMPREITLDDVLQKAQFPWEKRATTALDDDLDRERENVPKYDCVHVLGSMVPNSDFQKIVGQLFGLFARVRIDINEHSLFWNLYNTEQGLAVAKIALNAIVQHFNGSPPQQGSFVAIEAVKNTLEPGSGAPLFSLQVFDELGKLIQVGAFSGTKFALKVRSHDINLELAVLKKVAAAEKKAKAQVSSAEEVPVGDAVPQHVSPWFPVLPRPEQIIEALQGEGVHLVPPHLKVIVGEMKLQHGNLLRRFREFCRNPWMEIRLQEEKTVFETATDAPRELDMSTNWGTNGSRTVNSWNLAVRLYELSQAWDYAESSSGLSGSPSGRAVQFEPSDAFVERFYSDRELSDASKLFLT